MKMKKLIRICSLMLALMCVLGMVACDIQGLFGMFGGDSGDNSDGSSNGGSNNDPNGGTGDNSDDGQGGNNNSDDGNKEPSIFVVDSGKCGDGVSWSLDSTGSLTVSGNGKMYNYSSSSMPYYQYLSDITKVTVGEGVTSVGECAFYGFDKLSEVSLPETLIFIGKYAFYECAGLGGISIPASVMQIGAYAFRKSGIASVSLGSTNGWKVDEAEVSSEELAVSESAVELLKNTYFKNDWSRSIGGIEWVLSESGVLYIYGDGAMPDYGSNKMPWYESIGTMTDVVVYDGVTSIGGRAFYNATALESISFADSVSGIGKEAFYGCTALVELVIPSSVNEIGERAFQASGLVALTFECTEGWTCGGEVISLPDAETAATYLKKTYKNNTWTREEAQEDGLDDGQENAQENGQEFDTFD